MKSQKVIAYLSKLQSELLAREHITIELSRTWTNQFPLDAGVYVFREKGNVCYVGETSCIRERMKDLLNTCNHVLRRNIGNKHFSHHPLFEKATASRRFHPQLEIELEKFISKRFKVSYVAVELGRKELEEFVQDHFELPYTTLSKRRKINNPMKIAPGIVRV